MANRVDVRSLDVVVTSDCNLRCAYCYQRRRGQASMRWGTLRPAIDLLLASRRPHVKLLFIGGEPLLEFPLIARAVRYVDAHRRPGQRVEFELSTNGTLLSARRAAFLAAHDVDLQVSFDGVPEAQRARGASTFITLDRLVDRLRRDQPAYFERRLSVALTVTVAALPHLAGSIEYFLWKGVPQIVVSPALTPQAGWEDDGRRVLEEQFERLFEASLAHYRRTGAVPVQLLRRVAGRPAREPGGWLCGAGRGESLAIDVDGELSGCLLFARSYARFPPTALGRAMGGLRLQSIGTPGLADRLARYPEALARVGVFHNRALKRSSMGRCATCRVRRACAICPVSIVHQAGNEDPNRVPDFVCAFTRLAAEWRQRFPAVPGPRARLARRAPVPTLVREVLTAARS